jgi:acetylornithine deacetylase
MSEHTCEFERRVLAAVDDDEAVALLCDLVEAPSPNPPGDESEVAGVLARALSGAGIEPRVDEVWPGRPNLTAALGPSGGPTLLFNGHTDTMPPGEGWTSDPYKALVRSGRLYGLGACDMKAGLAAITGALLAVQRSGVPLRGRVYFDAVVDEEGTGAGTKYAVASGRSADFAIIAEPSELQVLRLGTGQVNFRVRFHGTAGHGSAPEGGRNAIYDAAAFVALIEGEEGRLRERHYRLIGPPSYNVGRIDGGLRTSIIPAECVVGVDRRIVPGQSVADAITDLEAILMELGKERPDLRVDWSTDVEYEPFEVSADLPGCHALRLTAAEVTGRRIGFRGLRATTDAVFLIQAGTNAVVFGPGNVEQAHRPDEFVSIRQLIEATRTLALTVVRLLC